MKQAFPLKLSTLFNQLFIGSTTKVQTVWWALPPFPPPPHPSLLPTFSLFFGMIGYGVLGTAIRSQKLSQLFYSHKMVSGNVVRFWKETFDFTPFPFTPCHNLRAELMGLHLVHIIFIEFRSWCKCCIF